MAGHIEWADEYDAMNTGYQPDTFRITHTKRVDGKPVQVLTDLAPVGMITYINQAGKFYDMNKVEFDKRFRPIR